MTSDKTLGQLAFFRVREEIALACSGEEGAAEVRSRAPLGVDGAEEIAARKRLCAEWMRVLRSRAAFTVPSWEPSAEAAKVLSVEGASLSAGQFSALLSLCRSALSVFAGVRTAAAEQPLPALSAALDRLPYSALERTRREVSRVIGDDGEVRDLPQLREIRRRMASLRAEIGAAMRRYTSDPAMKQVLETNVPAFRADRQVLAVRAGQRLRVPGIVHEVSASGQTFYIEPEEAVRRNNELVQEEYRLVEETRKILAELSEAVRADAGELSRAAAELSSLDASCAAARWGVSRECVCAEDAGGRPPRLVAARHPLLGGSAVPIDMEFLEGKTALIVTGPNTGGKTVSLKTFALLSLLNQAGFPIPAAEGTRLPLFDGVFADIGDEQSIDESLSTFSAHMRNIAQAVEGATNRSLVLLDELGSGTDPLEGGAVAMAALDSLVGRGAFVLATTHHGVLKNYGWTHGECMNASAEFDRESLSPTYRLLMGVPGESHALDIAERAGLPPEVVARAREYATGGGADVGELIRALTEQHAQAEARLRELDAREARLSEREARLSKAAAENAMRAAELSEREAAAESRFVREQRARIENLVRELREGEITREKNLRVRSLVGGMTEEAEARARAAAEEKAAAERRRDEAGRAAVSVAENGMKISTGGGGRGKSTKRTKGRRSNREALSDARPTFTEEELSGMRPGKAKPAPVRQEFEEGAEVLAGPARARGTLVRRERNGSWLVAVGPLRMAFRERDMVPLGRPNITSGADYTVELAGEGGTAGEQPKFELRLLGMREEEAVRSLRRQLDLCVMSRFRAFSVIHGKGDGILQQAVRDLLSHYPGVKDFRYAPPEDGGFGKTYVEMM